MSPRTKPCYEITSYTGILREEGVSYDLPKNGQIIYCEVIDQEIRLEIFAEVGDQVVSRYFQPIIRQPGKQMSIEVKKPIGRVRVHQMYSNQRPCGLLLELISVDESSAAHTIPRRRLRPQSHKNPQLEIDLWEIAQQVSERFPNAALYIREQAEKLEMKRKQNYWSKHSHKWLSRFDDVGVDEFFQTNLEECLFCAIVRAQNMPPNLIRFIIEIMTDELDKDSNTLTIQDFNEFDLEIFRNTYGIGVSSMGLIKEFKHLMSIEYDLKIRAADKK